ncbi:hypothetical protein RSSM_04322 [Rhodopirellula sallentina SM41]|uniref:Uncharacterized protein n=1 Tax=Rhodopirellula sallentina SM41 TaxID=1263870 RepID=M5U8S5_9BACT|nr:hypothetical protein RSSM_04322 [Rhodopirellula sallentina SM41]
MLSHCRFRWKETVLAGVSEGLSGGKPMGSAGSCDSEMLHSE